MSEKKRVPTVGAFLAIGVGIGNIPACGRRSNRIDA
jgi:hypothetical protein